MDKPQLAEPTIYDELAAYVEQHAEFYPNARAKLTAEGLAELEKLEKHWLQQWKERRGDVLTFVPHFQLRDYVHSALRKDLACRDSGWLGLWSDWGDHNQCPCGACLLPIFIICGEHTWYRKCCYLLHFIGFDGAEPGGPKISLWRPEPGGPKVLVRGPAVPSGGERIPHGTI